MSAKATSPERESGPGSLPFRAGLRMGLSAGAVGAVGNVLLLYMARWLGVSLLMPDPSGTYTPLHFFFPASLSLIAALVAPAVLALCMRVATERPLAAFWVVAGVVLVLSFGGPFALPAQVDLPTKITLNLMHVVAATPIMAIVKPERKGTE